MPDINTLRYYQIMNGLSHRRPELGRRSLQAIREDILDEIDDHIRSDEQRGLHGVVNTDGMPLRNNPLLLRQALLYYQVRERAALAARSSGMSDLNAVLPRIGTQTVNGSDNQTNNVNTKQDKPNEAPDAATVANPDKDAGADAEKKVADGEGDEGWVIV